MRGARFVIVGIGLMLAVGCAVEGNDFPSSNEGGNNGFNNGANNGLNNGNNGFNNGNNGFNNNGAADVGTDRDLNNGEPDLFSCFGLEDRAECEGTGCLWLTPGCAEPPDEFAPSCHPPVGCDEADYVCPDATACVSITYDPCLPSENGEQCNACGSELHACLPAPPECDGLDAEACDAAGCRYLTPGCEEPALADAGCHDPQDCETDADCDDGLTCTDAVYDPCAGENCEACAATARICLP